MLKKCVVDAGCGAFGARPIFIRNQLRVVRQGSLGPLEVLDLAGFALALHEQHAVEREAGRRVQIGRSFVRTERESRRRRGRRPLIGERKQVHPTGETRTPPTQSGPLLYHHRRGRRPPGSPPGAGHAERPAIASRKRSGTAH